MSTLDFYTVALTRCHCGKAATVEVRGSGGARYDTCCDACSKRRIRELTKSWNERSIKQQRQQIEDTR